MNRMKIAYFVTMLVCLFTSPAHAGFDEGLKAYNKKDYATAMQEWQEAAAKGETLSENNIGVLYDKGLGVPQDDAKAFEWYTRAANHGVAVAQFTLGNKYDLALGVAQDYKQAIEWYIKAAEQGHVLAQYNLGILYANARGTPQDYLQAAKWYTKAAKQCYAQAQINLWDIYTNMQGIPPGDNKFVHWYFGPKEEPVCVKVGNVQSHEERYKISPTDYPNGIYVSVVRKPLWRDPIHFPTVEKILADSLKRRGFTIAENQADASATLAFNTSNDLDLAEIDKGQSNNVSRALSIADNVLGVVLRGKLSGAESVMANGVNLNLRNKMITMEANLSNPGNSVTKRSVISMGAYYSEDNYETSTKLLILAFDEWAKLHVVENKSQPAVAATQAVVPSPAPDTAQANPEPAKN